VITRENAVIIANVVAYINSISNEDAVYGIENHKIAIQTSVPLSLRSIVGEAAFVFRDVIKYILPTLLALVLFAPLATDAVSLDHLLFASILIGYVASLLVGNYYLELPLIRKHKARVDEQIEKNNARWNYTALTTILDKDERDALYLTDSYAALYLLFSAYFLAYAVTVTVMTSHDIWSWSPTTNKADLSLKSWCLFLWGIGTKTFVGSKVPSLILILIGFLFSRTAWWAYLLEYKVLHLHVYPALAKRFHSDGQVIAQAIWGRIRQGGEPLKSEEIQMVDRSNQVLATTTTDDTGDFIFENMYSKYLHSYLYIRFTGHPGLPPRQIYVAKAQIPEFNIDL
jgi:hypothetical protein